MESKELLIRNLELRAQDVRSKVIYYDGMVRHLEEKARLYKKNYRLIHRENRSWIKRWRESEKADVKLGYLEYVRINDEVLNRYNRWYNEVNELLIIARERFQEFHQMLISLQRQIDHLRAEE